MSKKLVAYFSASGITAKLSERLAQSIGADIFEIKPETPYTSDDLNWKDKHSRSSVEMNDRSSRPAISNIVDNIDQYDTVFVGFPIWWHREPSIIDTFIEQYDFKNKNIVPFATSGESTIGDISSNIKELAKGANVAEGRRFESDVSSVELSKWATKEI